MEMPPERALADFDARAPQNRQVEFMRALEDDLVQIYADENANLEAPDLVRSAAEIAASHAQVRVALEDLSGKQG